MEMLNTILQQCIECNLCQEECAFLSKYGSPKEIAETYNPEDEKHQSMAFECSLCGLCAAVCPSGINPARMFLEIRQEAVRQGGGDFPEHAVIRDYESRGTSQHYTYYAFPKDCETVFFPGCTFPGTRPGRVIQVFEYLRKTIPDLGIVLDCCTKPSHDLGRANFFENMFDEMKSYLLTNGVRAVVVACPNCYEIFKEHGTPLKVTTVYEILATGNLPETNKVEAVVTIHDPCSVRFEEPIHGAVRDLADGMGLTVQELPHSKLKTLCCGEGGAVGFVSPELSKGWCLQRKEEGQGRMMLTYCAGCVNALKASTPAAHILDLVFEPEETLSGKVKVSRAPITYLNRLRLKRKFKKLVDPAVTRERTYTGEEKSSKDNFLLRLLLVMLIIGAISALRVTGATKYLEQETLRTWIQSYGMLGPAVYMLVYTVAPALFLPGLPITIVGGLLFGPVWGVVYTITSSTLGACLAFIISRYVSRSWVESKLKSPRWQKLDEEVQRHGWKVVAFTRLIPLFPFNLLNYAFGLTKIKFSHYAITTFICMLPACIAFIVFSSSLLEFLRGRFSLRFFFGLLLVIAVSSIPLLYQNHRRRKTHEIRL
jgi:uncharacterized membrane protein YdjX (TVP38/TMEM64 family)/Fe-S oxidoreductase